MKLLFASLILIFASSLRADDFFELKIEPLLRARCFECHSHGGKMKAGLALDARSGWEQGGDSGPAIVPGKPERSLLIKMVRWQDKEHQMPPKKKLPAAEIALLEEWVERGAPDPRKLGAPQAKPLDWWSLKPLKQPEVPPGAHPVDAFIRARLNEQGLKPAQEADRRTLIRRLYLNLHGLLPMPKDVETFISDPDPQAYERLVDRLLLSPRYGERWARHWLDTVHFADTHGCEHDKERPNAWRFRDYVIDRLNKDVSWARFIREQLAVDVFYPEESQLIPALGFIGAGPLELSRKTTAPVTFSYLDRDNMVTQTMAAFASATANCARCHAHKFDPITQEDYYALQAVFAGVDKAEATFDLEKSAGAERKAMTALLQAVEKGEQDLLLAADTQAMSKAWWAGRKAAKIAAWHPLKPGDLVSARQGTSLTALGDGSVLAGGQVPLTDVYTITAETSLQSLTAIRLDVLPHDSLPMKGPGRAGNGNFHLNEFECELLSPGRKDAIKLSFGSASADYEQWGSWTAAAALDGKPRTAWAIHPKVGQPHHAVFVLKEPMELAAGSRLKVTLKQIHGGAHIIGRFKLSVSDGPQDRVVIVPADVLAAWKVPEEERSENQQLALIGHAVKHVAKEKLAALPPQVQVFAVSKKAKVLPVNFLKRGNIHKPEQLAQPGALSLVSPLKGRFKLTDPGNEASRRAALAEWLASRENPLTWRSIVNRVWHYHFGRGICDTPNDLGRMGGKPSHPELLDWLAAWFRDEAKGSLKALHRLILTSQAYRQQSTIRQAAATVDGDNRLLWRMNRLRLDAEQYRDSLRQVSGRLDLSMGGPGVKQFIQKKGVHDTPVLDYKAYDWNRPDAMRRSIYRIVWRGIPDPFMEAMDFPNLGLLAPRRGQTVSPLQSLVLFNHDFVLCHSKHLAAAVQQPESRSPLAWSDWQQVGPFRGGDFNVLHAKAFPPEEGIDFKAEYAGLRWQPSKLKDGSPLALEGINSAFYFHRSVKAAQSMTVAVSLGSDDSVRVWLNGKSIHEHKIERGLAPDQEKLTVRLRRGSNDLLIKVVNGAGPGGIYFNKGTGESSGRDLPVTAESVVEVCRLVYQRTPTPEEQSELLGYAAAHGLAAMCRLLFNSNEFLFVE